MDSSGCPNPIIGISRSHQVIHENQLVLISVASWFNHITRHLLFTWFTHLNIRGRDGNVFILSHFECLGKGFRPKQTILINTPN